MSLYVVPSVACSSCWLSELWDDQVETNLDNHKLRTILLCSFKADALLVVGDVEALDGGCAGLGLTGEGRSQASNRGNRDIPSAGLEYEKIIISNRAQGRYMARWVSFGETGDQSKSIESNRLIIKVPD